jgi:hypothetical protein
MKSYLLLIIVIPSFAYAEETRLFCSGKEDYKRFSIKQDNVEHQSIHERNFTVVFDELKQLLFIEDYNLTMCYINPFNIKNGTVELDSRVVFNDREIKYFCTSQTKSAYDTSTNIGVFTINRFSGFMSSHEQEKFVNKDKVLSETKGVFNCILETKKF